jgi:hypothetical protein
LVVLKYITRVGGKKRGFAGLTVRAAALDASVALREP